MTRCGRGDRGGCRRVGERWPERWGGAWGASAAPVGLGSTDLGRLLRTRSTPPPPAAPQPRAARPLPLRPHRPRPSAPSGCASRCRRCTTVPRSWSRSLARCSRACLPTASGAGPGGLQTLPALRSAAGSRLPWLASSLGRMSEHWGAPAGPAHVRSANAWVRHPPPARSRDVESRVRCEVITAIGEWAAACPATFLCDAYLKYLAWAQVRRAPGVRGLAPACMLLLGGACRARRRIRDRQHPCPRRRATCLRWCAQRRCRPSRSCTPTGAGQGHAAALRIAAANQHDIPPCSLPPAPALGAWLELRTR